MGALSALGARGYKTTTGIVGVEVDPEAPETLRHLLKKILRVGLEEGRTGAVGDGGSARGRKALPAFPVRAGRVLPSLASRVSEGERKKNLE